MSRGKRRPLVIASAVVARSRRIRDAAADDALAEALAEALYRELTRNQKEESEPSVKTRTGNNRVVRLDTFRKVS
jgi:hypothetical protein